MNEGRAPWDQPGRSFLGSELWGRLPVKSQMVGWGSEVNPDTLCLPVAVCSRFCIKHRAARERCFLYSNMLFKNWDINETSAGIS